MTVVVAAPKIAFAKEAWNSPNDPSRVLSRYESRLSSLPAIGQVSQALWSDTYWPHREGGAAWRWQYRPSETKANNPHVYSTLSPYELARMTDAQISQLSPAEKFDIAQGRFDYPTVQKERARTRTSDEKWFGLCHAVAMVTTLFREPQTRTLDASINGQSRAVTFYSSDIKALVALSANRATNQSTGLGERCNSLNESSQECWDTNPGSFFIAITNMVGLYQKPIILDVDRGVEVWNAVVKSYSARITESRSISRNAAYGTAREVRVDMSVEHTVGAKPNRNQVGGSYKTVTYSFTLELDHYDQVIGGEWISTNRPDMLWMAAGQIYLDPEMSFVGNLAEPLNPGSRAQAPSRPTTPTYPTRSYPRGYGRNPNRY